MSIWLLAVQKLMQRGGNTESKRHLLHWLMSLGGVGLFGVALLDSSVIPLPLPGSADLLLLLLTAHRYTSGVSAAGLAACAWAGSIAGGLLCWSAGRKGGEVALERSIPHRILGRVKDWVGRHGAWTVGIATLLPPPVPLTPFLLAAGALKVPRGRFLLFYGMARAARYGLLAWLGVTYGRHIVRLWQKNLASWTAPVLSAYAVLLAIAIGYGLWKFLRHRKNQPDSPSRKEEMA